MRMSAYRSILGLCLLGLLALPALPQMQNMSQVRVVHASPDAPAVDIYVDGNLTFEGIRYKEYTDHTPLPPGSYDLRVTISGSATEVLGGPVTLAAGQNYTFYAMGRVDPSAGGQGLTLVGVGDDLIRPNPDQVKVRVVHAASAAPFADVYVTAPFAPLPQSPLIAGLPFTIGTGSLVVPAGAYQARVTPAGSRQVAINSGRVELMGGTVISVVALDPSAEDREFELLVLTDSK